MRLDGICITPKRTQTRTHTHTNTHMYIYMHTHMRLDVICMRLSRLSLRLYGIMCIFSHSPLPPSSYRYRLSDSLLSVRRHGLCIRLSFPLIIWCIYSHIYIFIYSHIFFLIYSHTSPPSLYLLYTYCCRLSDILFNM